MNKPTKTEVKELLRYIMQYTGVIVSKEDYRYDENGEELIVDIYENFNKFKDIIKSLKKSKHDLEIAKLGYEDGLRQIVRKNPSTPAKVKTSVIDKNLGFIMAGSVSIDNTIITKELTIFTLQARINGCTFQGKTGKASIKLNPKD